MTSSNLSSHPVLPARASDWHLFIPKLVTTLREGYSLQSLRADAVSGLTVAIVALPLAMAIAVASGTTPDKGLVTAIVAGFLISALGGSRFQIGGPTAAFIVVVFNVIATQGYDGLVIATTMAGLILIACGFARVGTWIKYIPEPVVTGFTSGIAILIVASQLKDIFGLDAKAPAEFIDKLAALWAARETFTPAALGVSLGAVATIVALRRYAPRVPAFLVAVAGAAAATTLLHLPIETLGSRFGEIPAMLPAPHLPHVSLARIGELVPSAFTIAFLAGLESLLSAMVADGMTGRRHRSNCELVAQGVANCVSGLFGGMPATGAIARTATNIRSGARSPLAGMFHALFVLVFMVAGSRLLGYIPLAALAAVLLVVAWNMSEYKRVAKLMRMPPGDRLLLVTTLLLTVFVDLSMAIEVGVVMASILFMHRMADAVAIKGGVTLIEDDVNDAAGFEERNAKQREGLPRDVEVFQINGPLFFGVAGRFDEVLRAQIRMPRYFILRMRDVPVMDSSGYESLHAFVERCRAAKCLVILTGVQSQPRLLLENMDALGPDQGLRVVDRFEDAFALIAADREATARVP